jgi:D-inositol-3-phosphate glycosyltransferase
MTKFVPGVRPGTTGTVPVVALLTGCKDRPYAFGLAAALAQEGVHLDFVANKDSDTPELHSMPKVTVLDFKGVVRHKGGLTKLRSLASYYLRLIRYAGGDRSQVFHILWNNRLEYLDRTLLMLYYKLRGKRVVLTAHNVNQARRDQNDSVLNRLTLRCQYRLADHMFVHTARMKEELLHDFGVPKSDVTIIEHPINDAFPDTTLTPIQAKGRLGIGVDEKAILFLGRIRPYKGLEYLVSAFQKLVCQDSRYRLIIAGEPKKGSEEYLEQIYGLVRDCGEQNVILKDRFIPDEEMELYLKAADVLVLPYKDIAQSGILLLAFTFGLPVIAADVGSFRETIVSHNLGLVFKPEDSEDLAATIERFFGTKLFSESTETRQRIREHARRHHSWQAVGRITRDVYEQLMRQ